MNPDNTREEAVALLKQGKTEQARELCSALCHGSHDNPQNWMLLTTAQMQLGELDAAISSIRQALSLGGYSPQAVSTLAALLLHQGETAESDACFEILYSHNFPAADAHRLAANILRQLGDYANAIIQYQRAVTQDPNHFPARSELAAMLQENKQFDAALAHYEKLMDLRADYTTTHIGMGICLASTKRFDEAASTQKKAVQIDSSNTEAYFHLGETYQLMCRYPDAADCYRHALQLCPDAAAVHGSLARALRNQGDTQGALACLQRALELEPENATAHHELGICLYDERNTAAAKESFRNATRINPSMAQSRFFLGMIYAQDGDEAKAQEQFSEACRLWPYLGCFVDSFRYSQNSSTTAHYLSNRKQLFEFSVTHANNSGLFLEFGVYHGASINMIARLTSNTVHGFDTFQGLPADWVVSDGQREDIEPAGSYTTHGIIPEAPDNVQFHVGTFEASLPGFCQEHKELVSLMNIDCDLYDSTKIIFDHLGGQISEGTIIVFDDYFCFPGWRDHEAKAFWEYIEQADLAYEYLAFNFFTGQVVVRITS